MNLETFLQRREERCSQPVQYRRHCSRCRKPEITCYCTVVEPFSAFAQFAILIHKMEARRGIATGRMTHLCLSNSHLIEGTDFKDHPEVDALLADPKNHCLVLAPGKDSINLSELSEEARRNLLPADQQPVIFVIDGTWSQARRMRRLSTNLSTLPTVCFSPQTPSTFRVRKQPAAHCYSTIEAVQTCIRLLDPEAESSAQRLTRAFDHMVEQQLAYQKAGEIRYRPPLGKNAS